MNKKAFALSALFFVVALAWLAINIYWVVTGQNSFFRLVIPSGLAVAGFVMVYNEGKKKKRRHVCDVDKNIIP